MRATILAVFVMSLALANGQGFGFGGFSPVQQANWGAISSKVSGHLVQLASEQGQQFKLVALTSLESQVVAGTNYRGEAEFQNSAGQTVTCQFRLLITLSDAEDLKLNCAEQEYRVTKGQL